MSQLPSHASTYDHIPHRLCPVPESEMESRADSRTDPMPEARFYIPQENHSCPSWGAKNPDAHQPRSWGLDESQNPEKSSHQTRAIRWVTLILLTLHAINLATSVAIVALLSQVLRSQQKRRHIQQLHGTDPAWPEKISLAASIALLSLACTGIVKSIVFLTAEICGRRRAPGKTFPIFSTCFSAAMAAAWVSVIVYVEISKQKDDNLATWACARADAGVNPIVPYGAICNQEIVASRLAIAVFVVEMLIGTASAALVLWRRFPPMKK